MSESRVCAAGGAVCVCALNNVLIIVREGCRGCRFVFSGVRVRVCVFVFVLCVDAWNLRETSPNARGDLETIYFAY
jgi:hypothetical protein